jgi:hypothetical protein
VDARPGSVPRLNGAVTAQRAIPTNFGFRVERRRLATVKQTGKTMNACEIFHNGLAID